MLTLLSTRLLILSLLCLLSYVHAHNKITVTPFEVGDSVRLECSRRIGSHTTFSSTFPPLPPPPTPKNGQAPPVLPMGTRNEDFGPAWRCEETKKELTFKFGEDGFLYCGLFLSDESLYNFTRAVIDQEIGWSCRVPVSKDYTLFLPVEIPLWGFTEPTHLHVNYHMNFVFHAMDGQIVGAAVYPVRDRFQMGRVGSIINLHGPVKWFSKHSFQGLSALPDTNLVQVKQCGSTLSSILWTMFWCVLCILLTILLLALVYVHRLKPALVKRYTKGD